MEHVLNLALEPSQFGLGDAKRRFAEIALDSDQLLLIGTPGFAQCGKLLL